MVLETTVICLDNSEYSRNGDYIPSRLEVQRDAANLICGAKTSQNPENAVGLLSAAGDRYADNFDNKLSKWTFIWSKFSTPC